MALLISSSRDVIQVMLLATVFLCGLTAASGGCPRGCKCDADSGTVSCLHIGSFPTELPAATKNITILQSVFNEIPTGAFDNLQQLESITFQEMTVGTIQRRAFYRIGRGIHSKELKFVMVTIENIERGAFEELEDFKSILISNANLSHVSSSGFNKLNNIASFVITTATIHTLRSNSFTSFSNVTDITIMDSTIDLIEQEAFSHFTHVKRFSLFRLNVGSLGSRFVTLDGTEIVNILQNTFELWKDCAFCGINAANVEISRNIVNGTEGNVFRGIRVVTALGIISNTLPFIVARFLPFDLPDQALINFSRNKLTSIICDGLGTDYPSNIIYSIGENEVTCDCRLNWMWKIWSNTHATHTLTPGFVCAGPEKQSLSDYFRKVSTSEITPPCNGIEPVNDCGGPTTDSGSQTTINATAAVAMIKARWMSALVVVILTLMAS